MLKQVVLAAIAATALSFAVSSANAGRGGCYGWGCGMNGTQLTGLAFGGSDQIGVTAVILPSGEVVEPIAGLQLAEKDVRRTQPQPKPEPQKEVESDPRMLNFEIQ